MNTSRAVRLVLIFLALISIVRVNVNAQEQNLYCIGVKQGFSSWGSCSSDPDFLLADFKINDSYPLIKVIYSDSLNRILTFRKSYYNNSSSKDISKLKDADSTVLSKITVHTYANDIRNDHELSYNFEGSDLKIGETTLSCDASDPCNNLISSHREGYTMTTTVYIDDPINLTNVNTNTNSSYCLDYDVLTLKVDNYYDNKHEEEPVLEVALDDGGIDWKPLENKVIITPGLTFSLTYEQIAGRKDGSNSNFFKWMGCNLKFRVVKTLLNGTKTFGKVLAGVKFYPNGIQFSIENITRTFCNDTVTVYVVLENSTDKEYFKLNRKYFYWKVEDKVGLRFDCYMLETDDPMRFKIQVDRGNYPKDPFNDDNLDPIEWKLQLQDLTVQGQNTFYCVKSFTIPPKPGPITATQTGKDLYPIGNPEVKYDIPDMNNPYALLSIVEDVASSYQRKPYRIMEGSNELLSIENLPAAYDEMTPAEKAALDAEFDERFANLIDVSKNPNNPYKSYFALKYKQWFDVQTVAQINHPSGAYRLFVDKYHSHMHTHSCTHTHEHEHWCYSIFDSENNPVPGSYYCTVNHVSLSAHDLCDNGHSHINSDSPGDIFQQHSHAHTHTASHDHIHTHIGIHAHGEDTNYDFTVIRKFTYSTGSISDFSTIYNNITNVSLSINGYNVAYVLRKDGSDINIPIWNESYIMNSIYPKAGVASTWYDEYKAIYKGKWLAQRLGVKVSRGIRVNQDQYLNLVDADGCPYETFKVHVKAPVVSFTTISTTNPSGICNADGTATIRYNSGGTPPYIREEGTLSAPNAEITVKGLKYGVNTVQFFDANTKESASTEVTISNPSISVSSTPQTCTGANGSVIVAIGGISGTITYKLINDSGQEVASASPGSNTCTFNNLPADNYTVEVTSGSCISLQKIIEVLPQIFDISIIPTDATTLSGTGGVAITFANRVNSVSWVSGAPSVFNPSENSSSVTYSGVVPNPYSITARHTDASGKTCDVSKSFTVNRPQFQASVNLEETDEGFTANTRLISGNSLISPYKFRLLNGVRAVVSEGQSNGNLSQPILISGTYTINLQYGSSDADICSFSYPQTPIGNAYQVTPPVCPGGNGSITLTPTGGIDGSNLLVSVDGLGFTNTFTHTVKGGNFTHFIKDDNTSYADVQGNPVTIYKSMVKRFTVNIPEPVAVSAQRVIPADVTCAGLNNGSVSVAFLRGGSGKYLYRVDGGVWNDTLATVAGLAPGDHSVYLRDSQNGCPVVNLSTFNISQPDSLKIERLNVVQPICEQSNGSILSEVKGGNGSYKYEWLYNGSTYKKEDAFLPDTIFSLGDILSFGLYHLKVVDSYNCTLEQSVTLNEYFNPAVDGATIKDVRCYGESNGEITVLSTGGSNLIDELYINEVNKPISDTIKSIAESFKNLRKGSYSISSIDVMGCRSNSSYPVVIHQPDTLLYLKLGQIQPVIAKGSKTGGLQATVFGGNSGLKEVKIANSQATWANTSSQRDRFTFTLDSLLANKYSIIAVDGKGCSDTLHNIEVIEPPLALNLKVVDKKNALCKAQTGSIEVQAEGGWGDYRFKRDSYNAFYPGNRFENLYAGSYTITVMDSLGATFSEKVAIYEPKDSLSSWVSGYVFPTCANNGEIQLTIDGGTPPYQVFNRTSSSACPAPLGQGISIAGLAAGEYTMRVTDGNGCLFDVETQLPKTQMLEVSFADPQYPTSKNSSDGVIHAVTRGGVGPLEYKWKQRFGSVYAETSSSLRNTPSGHYELTVTEKGGCSVTKPYYLPGIDDYPFSIAEIEDETSLNAKNGYCKLTSLFNTWKEFDFITPSNDKVHFNSGDSNGQFSCVGDTVFLENLEGGTYFVSGLSADTNRVYAEFTIKPYTPFVVKSVEVENVERIGDSNGRIAILVEGGAGGNTFEWKQIAGAPSGTLLSQNSPEGSLLGNINAGTYQVNVTDRFKNTLTRDLNVDAPHQSLKISIDSIKHASCYTYEDASVYLHADGGWGDYQFRYDSAKYYTNDTMFVDLDARDYYFYITDKMGVVDSIAFKIEEPKLLISETPPIDSVDCSGDSNGIIYFKISGGTAPYQFADIKYPNLWTIDTIAMNIPAGNHEFIITDKNGCICQSTQTVKMLEPDPLLFEKIKVTHTTCNTDNGAIEVQLKGGTPFKKGRTDYRYEWLDFNSNIIGRDSTITKLAQKGIYFLNVYDVHGCYQSFDTTISSSTNPAIIDVDTTPVLCHGDYTGSAFIKEFKPGNPSSTCHFTWSNGVALDSAGGFGVGVDTVRVYDDNGCHTVKYFEITQPDSLRISITDRKNALCFGYNDAFLQAQGLGGVGGYSYLWSTGATTNRIENLFKGDYRLTIKDANGCETVESFTIIEPDKLEVDLGDDIKMCPGNSRVIDGQEFASHKWSNSSGVISNERYLTVRDANSYYLEVTDNIGCFAWDTLGLSIGNDALKSDFLLSSQAGQGDTLALIELSNMVIDSVSWYYNKNAFAEVENKMGLDYMLFLRSLQTGIYNIELSAFAGGCISTSTKQIEIIADSGGEPDDDGLGYKDPLIKSFAVNPNPNDGNFYAEVKLREVSDINLVLFSVSSGLKMDERFENQLSEYNIGYNLSNLNSGVYLLILKAGNERKQVKIIIQ